MFTLDFAKPSVKETREDTKCSGNLSLIWGTNYESGFLGPGLALFAITVTMSVCRSHVLNCFELLVNIKNLVSEYSKS